MKVSEQRGIAASKGNQILGLISVEISHIMIYGELIVPLLNTIDRPRLEYSILHTNTNNVIVCLMISQKNYKG